MTSLEERARELYVPGKVTMKEVAEELGISKSSVLRYVNPRSREVGRRSSRAWKARQTGICERCGGETHYNGQRTNGASRICAKCNSEPRTHCLYGHELSGDNDLRGRGQPGWSCRICRNAYMREYARRRYAEDPAYREMVRLRNARAYAKRLAKK